MKALSLPKAQPFYDYQKEEQNLQELKSNIKQALVERIDNIIFLLAVFGMLTLVFISSMAKTGLASSNSIPALAGHEADVEALLGDFSDYYICISSDKNAIEHTISDIQDGNDIYLLIPSTLNEDDIVVDFYTCWDECLASYKCNFIENPVYTVKGKNIHLLKSNLQFIYVDVDSEEFVKMNELEKKTDTKIAANVYSQNTKNHPAVLKPRGATSWGMYSKKPYTLKFDEKTDMFGFGPYKTYNLLANAADKTLLKNEIFFDLANDLDLDYTPDAKNVNLFVNNSFKGVYTVTTKVDVKPGLLDLKQGDFLINWESPNAENRIDVACDMWLEEDKSVGTYVDLVWPKAKYANTSLNASVKETVQKFIDVIEDRDSENLRNIVDLESFAKYYWVQEISLNTDAWTRSNYIYYKADEGKFYAGPVWDFDLTLGSNIQKNGYSFDSPEGFIIRNGGYFEPLFRHKEFIDEVNRIYKEYDLSQLMENSYQNYCVKADAILSEGNMNFIESRDEYNWFDFDYGIVDNYEDFVKYKTDFYKARIDWIRSQYR